MANTRNSYESLVKAAQKGETESFAVIQWRKKVQSKLARMGKDFSDIHIKSREFVVEVLKALFHGYTMVFAENSIGVGEVELGEIEIGFPKKYSVKISTDAEGRKIIIYLRTGKLKRPNNSKKKK